MTDLIFYQCAKRLNSTKRPTVTTFPHYTLENVSLKEPTNLIRPTFILNRFSDVEDYNMVSWDNRYYYIENITYLNGNMVEISCRMDVLATYKTEIGNTNQYILRGTDENMIAEGSELFDSELPVYAGTTPRYTDVDFSFSDGFYVLGIIATGLTSVVDRRGVVSYITMKNSDLLDFIMELSNVTGETADLNPLQYVVSCVYIPINPTWAREPANDLIRLGSIGGEFEYYVTHTPIVFPIPSFHHLNTWDCAQFEVFLEKHPQYDGNNEYFNYKPFYSAELFAGPFGTIELPTDLWRVFESGSGYMGRRRFFISIVVDLPTGDGKLLLNMPDRLMPSTPNDMPFLEVSAKVGVPIELAQISRYSGSDLAGIATGLLSMGGMAISQNPFGVVSSLASIAANTYNAGIPKLSTAGASGSFIGLTEKMHIIEKLKYQAPSNDIIGKLVCYTFDIKDAETGSYIQTQNAHVGIIAPSGVIEEIENLMNNGFYWE